MWALLKNKVWFDFQNIAATELELWARVQAVWPRLS
eukprot:CAMPEP_0170362716 /NCGR_PEP_ID=MMETSP0117_2-20130122/4479_1 /TAXON_ID=400756 /ORGANISM="Durinskia baltica, Strain CSIRO CS-38" /LENGTH=35 /DNA_ID= /DNA_START= /DNA_END= /DNA_ORIENTATION=